MGWQLGQKIAFMIKNLGRDEARSLRGTLFESNRKPLERLTVEIHQALKLATRKEICFDDPKTPFVPRFSIRMSNCMADELEAVTLGEGPHFGAYHRVFARTPQTGQIRVVDNAYFGRVLPMHECLMQKTLHRKSIEIAVKLQVPPLRVAQIDQACNYFGPLS